MGLWSQPQTGVQHHAGGFLASRFTTKKEGAPGRSRGGSFELGAAALGHDMNIDLRRIWPAAAKESISAILTAI